MYKTGKKDLRIKDRGDQLGNVTAEAHKMSEIQLEFTCSDKQQKTSSSHLFLRPAA
jgi:hypothetical protein